MVKNLQKYLLVLIGFILLSNLTFAQVEKGKSRLDIGKKPTTATKAPLQRSTFVSKPMPTEVKLDKPTVVNQYFRNALLNGSTKSASVKSTSSETITPSFEKSVSGEGNDKLYSSEKLTVSNIYPNPANDFATVDYSITGNVNDVSMSFYNLLGNEVGKYDLDKNERKLKVATTDWDSGVYLYQLVVDGKKIVTKKLLVRHN